MHLRKLLPNLAIASVAFAACLAAAQKPAAQKLPLPPLSAAPSTSAEERAALHQGSDWPLIVAHLPDPTTADAGHLEMAGDVLRARRFPEDALDFYGYAMARGGNVSLLLKKMGVVRLELRQNALAHEMFLRSVRAHKNDSEAWNDLGVSDFAMGQYVAAIAEYKHAVKLNKKSGIFHSNLGMAYLGIQDTDSARTQFAVAIKLEPNLMESRDHGGTTAHVLSSQNYGSFCFEMATLAATDHRLAAMRQWLARANDRGFDVRAGMDQRDVLRPWLKDAEVRTMLETDSRIRRGSVVAIPLGPGSENDPTLRVDN